MRCRTTSMRNRAPLVEGRGLERSAEDLFEVLRRLAKCVRFSQYVRAVTESGGEASTLIEQPNQVLWAQKLAYQRVAVVVRRARTEQKHNVPDRQVSLRI